MLKIITSESLLASPQLNPGKRAIDAGFQVHLSQPIYPAQLIQMVANLTGRIKAT
jgi:CheY-like chemotaxis protein